MTTHNHQLEKRFTWALALTGLILAAEIAGGLLTGSLALLSDAAHIFLDMLALAMSLGAMRLAARPADERYTYGFHRWQVLAALANGATLLVVAFGIGREAWLRIQQPAPVLAGPMLVVASVGLAVNLVVMRLLQHHDHDDLNTRSAFLHVLGDTLSSVGVIAAGVIILLTGWTLVDPLVSALIAAVILLGSWRVLRGSLHILVEGAPHGMTAGRIAPVLRATPGVNAVHDLHIWTLSPGFVALSAHVVVDSCAVPDVSAMQQELRSRLTDQFGINHTTIQIEAEPCSQGDAACGNGHRHIRAEG